MRALSTAAVLGTLLVGGVPHAPAQAPSPSPTPSPSPPPPSARRAGPGGAARKPGPGKAAEPQDVRLRAEEQEVVEKGHYQARGFVDLQMGEVRLQSDVLDLYETEKPDGTKGRRLVADGNVVFLRGEERISGDHLDMDLDAGQGTFTNAYGYVQPGVFVEARTIERLDAETYRVEAARFTSCNQPNPRWGFSASSAKIHVDDKIVARNALFKVKSVPAFYVPYFLYPIKEDQRSTGLLFPHFGYSTIKGYQFGEGFFWAMGRSFDQTFYADHYSRFGWGYGHEFRYLLDSPSRGSFRSYVLEPQGGGDLDYDLDWRAIQLLPGRLKASLSVRQYSNLFFQQRFQDSLNQASIRSRRSVLAVQRAFKGVTFQATADSNETFFDEERRVNRRLPAVRLSHVPQKIGRSPLVFGFDAEGDSLVLGDQERVDRYSRFDMAPSLSAPVATTFLQATPALLVRYTRYGATLSTENTPTEAPLERRYFESSLELRGPTFSRVFTNPGKLYSDKFKHVIGPEVTFRYRTAVLGFTKIPKFDFIDQQLGTNQVDYGIVQRFLAKRPGPGGKAVPYEFLSWRIGQTYYIQIKDNQNEFDPNYSSAIFGPGGVPDHNSPLQSNVKLHPAPQFSTNFDVEYDVNFKQLRTLGLSTSLNTSWVGLQGGWSRAKKLAVEPAQRETVRDTLRGGGRLRGLGFTLEGSGDYDIVRKNLFHSHAKLRYDVQCCGFVVDALQYKFNDRNERVIRFSIELANIGSIGNFLGEEPLGAGGGVGGGGGFR